MKITVKTNKKNNHEIKEVKEYLVAGNFLIVKKEDGSEVGYNSRAIKSFIVEEE